MMAAKLRNGVNDLIDLYVLWMKTLLFTPFYYGILTKADLKCIVAIQRQSESAISIFSIKPQRFREIHPRLLIKCVGKFCLYRHITVSTRWAQPKSDSSLLTWKLKSFRVQSCLGSLWGILREQDRSV